MTQQARWGSEDFEEMSWHDAHVHGFQIVENDGDNGTAELILDIDYILEWHKGEHRVFSFVVTQARLQFHEISNLRFTLDYVRNNAGMCAFSIDRIQRERVVFLTGYSSYKWKIEISWPGGVIEFQSPGYTQIAIGQPHTQQRQSLAPTQRNPYVTT